MYFGKIGDIRVFKSNLAYCSTDEGLDLQGISCLKVAINVRKCIILNTAIKISTVVGIVLIVFRL